MPNNFADGKNGPHTQKALKAFQKASGLFADGVYGPATEAALQRAPNGQCNLGAKPQRVVTQTAPLLAASKPNNREAALIQAEVSRLKALRENELSNLNRLRQEVENESARLKTTRMERHQALKEKIELMGELSAIKSTLSVQSRELDKVFDNLSKAGAKHAEITSDVAMLELKANLGTKTLGWLEQELKLARSTVKLMLVKRSDLEQEISSLETKHTQLSNFPETSQETGEALKGIDEAKSPRPTAAQAVEEPTLIKSKVELNQSQNNRDPALVQLTITKAPGLNEMTDAQEASLREGLVSGECVTTMLEDVFAHVNRQTLLHFLRQMNNCPS